MQLDEPMINELTEARPQSEGVLNSAEKRGWCSRKGLLVEPYLEFFDDRFRESPAQFDALVFRQSKRVAVNQKETFDRTDGVVGEFFFGVFCIFKISVDVSPASGRGGCVSVLVFSSKGFVVLFGAISEEEAEKLGQKICCIFPVSIFGKLVDVVWMVIVTAEERHAAGLSLPTAFDEKRHGGIVTDDDSTVECSFAHQVRENRKFVSGLLAPARQSRASYTLTFAFQKAFENQLLSVEKEIVSHFRSNDVSKELRSWVTFVDRLIWFKGRYNIAFALSALILILNMFDALEASWNEFKLKGNSEAEGRARDVTAGAVEVFTFKLMLRRGLGFSQLGDGSTAATVSNFELRRFSIFDSFCGDIFSCPLVEVLAGAFEVIGGGLGGARAELVTAPPAVFVLELDDTFGQGSNQNMAFFDGTGQLFWDNGFRGLRTGLLFGHVFNSRVGGHYIIQ
jgi:hypothetical protein